MIGTAMGAVAVALSGVCVMLRYERKRAVDKYRLEKAEKDLAAVKSDAAGLKMDVAVLSSDVSVLKTDVASLNFDMKDVKSDVQNIKSVLVQHFPNVYNLFAMKKSPRRLNPLGERVFGEIGGAQFLETHKDFFFAQMDAMKPGTKLDVENAAAMVLLNNTGDPMFNGIKDYIYDAPSMEVPDKDGGTMRYDLTLGDACYILSLPLRDMYLQERGVGEPALRA